MTELARLDMPDWIRALAASQPSGAGDRRGTANLIDAAARARAAACIRTGNSVSLARPLLGGDYNTHLDALSHVAVDGTFYGGAGDGGRAGIGRRARPGRPGDPRRLRGHPRLPWHGVGRPPGRRRGHRRRAGPCRARPGAGLVLEPGDALRLDMGRDRFEAARGASAHVPTWAMRLLLVGKCDFAALRRTRGGQETGVAGALVVSLLAVEGANGVNLNPLVLS